MSIHSITLIPAYGRDYKSAADVKEDFLAGKDFLINDISSRWDGKYTSIRDFSEGDEARIRYAKLRKVILITVRKEHI